MKRSLSLYGWCLMLLALAPAAAQDKKPEPLSKLTVRLLDAEHRPVSGAHVGMRARFWQKFFEPEIADAAGFMYVNHCVSDKDGLAHIESKADNLVDYWGRVGIVAHHDERGLIAFAAIDAAHLTAPVEITLVPQCRVSGKIVCPELAKRGRKVGFISVSLTIDRAEMMDCKSERDGDFHLLVPPGRYNLDAWGTYVPSSPHLDQLLTIPSGKREMELTLTVGAKKFALLIGRPAPELRDIAAWKNSPPLKLSDLKGKCVLLEFWGHWCGPCVARMPQTFDLYDRYSKQGLVVIGVHVDFTEERIDSVEKLDAKLAGVRKQRWRGRDLPFPVALARPQEHCAVAEDYGISQWPTMLLIDRRGNIVDFMTPNAGGLAMLQKVLEEKPMDNAPKSDHR